VKAVSGKEMGLTLERRGWRLDRIRGSHHIYKNATGNLVSVPVHGNKNAQAWNATGHHEGRRVDRGGFVKHP
jgi:predicted RNA binding protein YcfA (HicA-like mRNA interferase family)